MRGESIRGMELPDLHSVLLDKEGYSQCYALILVMRQGKTNQFGRLEVAACLRNRKVSICPFGALGFYLFWRWHMQGEDFPSFARSSDWYNIKLLKSGTNLCKEVDYRVHKESIESAFAAIGLKSKAKTHVGRGSSARMAELGGASEAQIRRLGRWNHQTMENCYLTSLPREAMRTLAGFSPSQGQFFLSRMAVTPPSQLTSKLFPQVEYWLSKLEVGDCEQSIAAGGFLHLLKLLRIVILQDSVFLRIRHPTHPVWKHCVFSDPSYISFAEQLSVAVANQVDPAELQLQRAMPIMTDRISSLHEDLTNKFNGVELRLSQQTEELRGLKSRLEDIMNGNAEMRLCARFDMNWPSSRQTSTLEQRVDVNTNAGSSRIETIDLPRTYRLSRGIITVTDLWREWTEGLGGGPSVKELERKWGTAWCEGNERRFFNRRKIVLEAIENRASQLLGGITEENLKLAAQWFEEKRQSQKKSLDWVQATLVARHPGIVLFISAVVTIILCLGLSRLEVETRPEKIIDKSFGFYSAVEEAQRAINAAHVEVVSVKNGIGLVKLMGRYSGGLHRFMGRHKQVLPDGQEVGSYLFRRTLPASHLLLDDVRWMVGGWQDRIVICTGRVSVAFGLNALYGRLKFEGLSEVADPWNPSNIENFIRYTRDRAYPVIAWELETEPSSPGSDWEDSDLDKLDSSFESQEREEKASFISTLYDALFRDGTKTEAALEHALEAHVKQQYRCYLPRFF
ncbi:hypothetical protein R1sor_025769 [Riccia sorocarpa]|uniref:Ndc10 domain-containing protein n=1 Tax=Riccia sorocarpa TaxID=122646 RepID=A0ABD3GD80_9MARC